VRFGCEPVVCVLPSKYPEAVHRATDSEGVLTTTGGATRQESVAAGLELVDTRTVVVHDAARPLVTEAMLKEVTAPLTEFVGAITALRMSETIKRADRDLVVETIDRSSLWRSQTPQAFRTEELRRAHNKAREESFVATDDAQLIERYGGRVAIVPGDPSNIKLTYEEDFIIAEALLAHRGAAGR
jgi:2-C-methyl-D-erythritol 4-phosphate cytidylyltransferase